MHNLCPICGEEHEENEYHCGLCGTVVKAGDLQAFHDVKNNACVDVCESCGSPEDSVLLEERLEKIDMDYEEFDEKYGPKIGPYIFNLPDELKLPSEREE